MHTRTALRALPRHELVALATEARATLERHLPARVYAPVVHEHALPTWQLVERVLLAQRVAQAQAQQAA